MAYKTLGLPSSLLSFAPLNTSYLPSSHEENLYWPKAVPPIWLVFKGVAIGIEVNSLISRTTPSSSLKPERKGKRGGRKLLYIDMRTQGSCRWKASKMILSQKACLKKELLIIMVLWLPALRPASPLSSLLYFLAESFMPRSSNP